MALHQSTIGQRVASHSDALLAILVFVAIIAAMLVATVVFGVARTGPSYDIVPDPAGLGLPF
jgi:hypothetical protein